MLFGGDPPRLLRLAPEGERRVAALLGGRPVLDAADAFVAGRLVAAGLAHPLADGAPVLRVVAVVPVRDRAGELARCLGALAGQVAQVLVVDDGSRDPEAVAAICRAAGASLVRRPVPGGPGAARNSGLAAARDADAVLFVDSDVEVSPGAVARLAAQLADRSVVAVAPRIRPFGGGTALARHLEVRSPLDLGPRPARVRPGGRVSFLPTACLLLRRDAATPFDEALRYGEDVDLVWRLCDAGCVVRYEPAVVVRHREPATWSAALARRYRYGTSAGPLARRHPGRLAPYRAAPLPAAAAVTALTAPAPVVLPVCALVVAAGAVRVRRAGVPAPQAVRAVAAATLGATAGLARHLTEVGLPFGAALLALPGDRPRRARRVLLLAVLARAADPRGRARLDPVRAALADAADGLAYAGGVWRGAALSRTIAPLLAACGPTAQP